MKDVLFGVGFMTMMLCASGIDVGGTANIIGCIIGLVMVGISSMLFNER